MVCSCNPVNIFNVECTRFLFDLLTFNNFFFGFNLKVSIFDVTDPICYMTYSNYRLIYNVLYRSLKFLCCYEWHEFTIHAWFIYYELYILLIVSSLMYTCIVVTQYPGWNSSDYLSINLRGFSFSPLFCINLFVTELKC